MEISERDEARFWSKVALPVGEGCMLWAAGKSKGGYGKFSLHGRLRTAHRVAYELLVGPIPDGLQLDHLCRVRHCVAPAHLEPVTPAENIRRGDAGKATGAKQRAKTHCPQGHAYVGDNLLLRPKLNGRACRSCARARLEAFRKRQRRAA